MSELEQAISHRVASNADLEGARELVDAHLDAISGGQSFHSFHQYVSFERVVLDSKFG